MENIDMARSENNLNAVFTDTANAIRAKTDTTATICPRDFADKINAIETGGGGMKAYFEAGGKCRGSTVTSFDGIINYSDTENVTDFSDMFSECTNLIKIPNIDMRNANSMTNCFSMDQKLTDADITTNANILRSAFYYCTKLKNIKLTDTRENYRINCYDIACYTESLQNATLSIPMGEDFKAAFRGSGVISANLGQLHKQSGTIHDGFNDSYTVSYVKAFENCPNLEEVTLDIGSTTNKVGVFVDLTSAFSTPNSPSSRTTPLRINFLNADADVYRNFDNCFMSNKFIESVPAVNCKHAIGLRTAFYECTNLKELKFYNIVSELDLHYCTKMTREALVEVLNNLAVVTAISTCILGETNLAKLTDEDKAIATNKGWTLE